MIDVWLKQLQEKYKGQADVFEQKKVRLLNQIVSIDWTKARRVHDQVIVPGVPTPELPASFDVPIERIGAADEQDVRELARSKVLGVDNANPKKSKFAVMLAAGGSGSEFRSDDPKGYLPGTPLSQMPLYAGLVKKIQAAAKYYGHDASFPIVVMTSDITHQKTVQFFEENEWFGMKDRIKIFEAGVLPLFNAKTQLPFLNAKGELSTGGTGHGETFDNVLVQDEVKKFLDNFGVEVVQYIAVDNQLNPIVDERLIGYGQKTWNPKSKDKRAHLALGVIKKNSRNDRLGNQLKNTTTGQWQHVGYAAATDAIKDSVQLGDPSFRVVWRASLEGSESTPWQIASKKDKDIEGNEITVQKAEIASDDKPRRPESVLVEMNREDAFEPIKKPDAVATTETLATSYLAQSNYWKRRVQASVGDVLTVDLVKDEHIALEIAAQEAFYMSKEELKEKLREKGIITQIQNILSDPWRKPFEMMGIYITDDWKVKFIAKDDPRLYFLNWQKSMLESPVAPNVDPEIHKGKTVLITGGAGYVASGVIYELLSNGSKVVVYDNQITPKRRIYLNKIIAAYPPGSLTIVENAELNNKDLMRDTMKQYKVDGIVHLGAYIAAGVSVNLPATYYQNNVAFTMNLLEAMREAGVKNLSFASSAGVFEGKKFNKYGLLDEDSLMNPQNPYGETKYLMEVLMKAYADKHGINYTALRFFNLAGAFYWKEIDQWVGEGHLGPETHLIPNLIKSFLYKFPFKIFGNDYPTPDGTNIRDYIHVLDIAHAIVKSLSSQYQAEIDGHQIKDVYTLGTGTPTSNNQIVQSFTKVLLNKKQITDPTELKVGYQARRAGDPPVLRASSEKANHGLAWRAKRMLDEIVESAYEYHNQEFLEGGLDLKETAPEEKLNVTEAQMREQVLQAIKGNDTITDSIKAEILLRLLVRSINPKMREIDKLYLGDKEELEALYKSLAEKEGGLFDLISTSKNGFVSAITQKQLAVSYLFKLVKDETAARNFVDDPNHSRQQIAQEVEQLIGKLIPKNIPVSIKVETVTDYVNGDMTDRGPFQSFGNNFWNISMGPGVNQESVIYFQHWRKNEGFQKVERFARFSIPNNKVKVFHELIARGNYPFNGLIEQLIVDPQNEQARKGLLGALQTVDPAVIVVNHLAHPKFGQIHELFYPNVDRASLAIRGGIDLNSKNLKLSREGQKVDISFNSAMVAQFRRGDFSGVRFQIFDVVPENIAVLLAS